MMVVPDVEDVFVPIQDDLFVDPQESRFSVVLQKLTCRAQIEVLLSRIETMFAEMHVPEPALGATVLAAVSALVFRTRSMLMTRRKSEARYQYS
jgi:protein transport protein SEC24